MVTGAGTVSSVFSRLKMAPHSRIRRKATLSSTRPSRRKWERSSSLSGKEDEEGEEWEEEEVALATYTSAILSLFDAGGGTQETFLSLVDKVGEILGASSVLNSVSEVFE